MAPRKGHKETRERRDQLRLTFAYRSRSRTILMPRAIAIVLLLLIPLSGTLYLAATCYFVFHDDLLASLTRHQIEMQYAYEDRIASLRRQFDDTAQNARTQEADFADRLQALAQRQDQIESRTTFVAALADRIKKMRPPVATDDASASLSTAGTASAPLSDSPPDPDVSVSVTPFPQPSPAPDGKPHPEGFDLRLPGTGNTSSNDTGLPSQRSANAAPSPIAFEADLPLQARIDDLAYRYDQTDRDDLDILNTLRQPANQISDHIRFVLASAGLAADHLSASAPEERETPKGASGGPFVPLPILSDGSAFATAATETEEAVDAAEKLRRILPHVPVARPLPGPLEVTSPFGPRTDPFLGTPALHTGIDLLDTYGAPVRATAVGVVSFAGSDGGYGQMVEVDHGNGLSTRYAHLSSIDVERGQTIAVGTVLGRIGETGRATGPHLHYEVRIDGQPVDPARFLKAGFVSAADASLPP